MVLEKDGDQLDRSREKRRSVRAREEKNILRTVERRKVTSCIETAFYNTLLKERYRGKDRSDGKTTNKT